MGLIGETRAPGVSFLSPLPFLNLWRLRRRLIIQVCQLQGTTRMTEKRPSMVTVLVGPSLLAAIVGAVLLALGVSAWLTITFWVWLVVFVLSFIALRAERRKARQPNT
jgi:fatty acid desaturase